LDKLKDDDKSSDSVEEKVKFINSECFAPSLMAFTGYLHPDQINYGF